METTWTAGREDSGRRNARIRRVVEACMQRREAGEEVPDDQLMAGHPELMPELGEELAALALIGRAREQAGKTDSESDLRPSFFGAELAFGLSDDYLPGYRLEGEIHRGGQGVVYKAIQESTRRKVAIKVLLGGPFADEQARARFEREVKLAAGLKHPHIVVVHDSGIAMGKYYYVMDYVHGLPIGQYVRLHEMGPREIVDLFEGVCDGVAYAQRHGVIHRDLKPSNILVGEDNTPYVVDFGLAKVTTDQLQLSQDGAVTESGHLLGTLHYMSPEQTGGHPDAIDVRTDVYSLGVILYELLTGTFPYETHQDITRVIHSIRLVDPPRPSRLVGHERGKTINSELDAIVLKAMEKEPSRRYQSAGELHQDLCAWLEGRPVSAKSSSSLYLIRKIAARHSFETLMVLTVLLTVGALGTIATQAILRKQAADAELGRTSADYLDHQQRAARMRSRMASELAFGWFLSEWEGGRLGSAATLRDEMVPGSPERIAMDFLLDETAPIEQLRSELKGRSPGLTHFAIGVRESRKGHLEGARVSFEQSMAEAKRQGDRWLAEAAHSRLVQLGPAGGSVESGEAER